MKIGVLAVQGAFAEHIHILKQLKVETVPVRLPQQIDGLDGLIIPGGESTTISKLLVKYDITNKILQMAHTGLPVYGTCAGMILLAKDCSDSKITPLGLMDIKVRRNAFGRQLESFESKLNIPVLGDPPFPAVFIRAPLVESIGENVEILAALDDDTIVAVRQDNYLASAFHPELTGDLRFHRYFLSMVNDTKKENAAGMRAVP